MPERRRDWGERRQLFGRSRQTRRVVATLAGLAICALALAGPTPAAKRKKVTSRTVIGQVLDGTENGIDGASVSMKDLQTGVMQAVYTRDGGHYQFEDLRFDHDYELQATVAGGKSEKRQVSSADTREKVVINFTIPPPSS